MCQGETERVLNVIRNKGWDLWHSSVGLCTLPAKPWRKERGRSSGSRCSHTNCEFQPQRTGCASWRGWSFSATLVCRTHQWCPKSHSLAKSAWSPSAYLIWAHCIRACSVYPDMADFPQSVLCLSSFCCRQGASVANLLLSLKSEFSPQEVKSWLLKLSSDLHT